MNLYWNEIIADTLAGSSPLMKTEVLSPGVTKVSLCYSLESMVQQDDCRVRLPLAFTPSFFWAPHLTPTPDHVIAEHVFRTPALIARGEGKTLILIPEVTCDGIPPLYLDLDAPGRVMTIGMSNSVVAEHILFRRAPGAVFMPPTVTLVFYLLAFAQELENPFRPVLDWLWSRYGQADTLQLPALDRLSDYCDHTYRWAFCNWKQVVWQEFLWNGQTVGAPVFIATVFQRPQNPLPCSERETRSIWNQAWFCSLRSATGLYRYARRAGNEELLAYARKTKELALAFPQEDGLFDSVIATEMEKRQTPQGEYWVSAGWESRYLGNSDRNPFVRNIRKAPRHILDMSFTAYHMLLWYEELEPDTRLLDYARRYGDRLVRLQDSAGYYPAWLDCDSRPMGVLDHSPESSMSAAFLLRLYHITKQESYLQSALRAIAVVLREIVPTGRWEDFETYWSCSGFWKEHVGEKIPRNDSYKQCNFSIYFTALALLEGWQATGDISYLDWGQRVIDELLMTQSSYQPKRIPIPVCGGFGVMNADAELNDARQSLFCELILRYGEALGLPEYQERGLAALRVSFSMMYCPENPKAKEQWELAWPFLTANDYGFNMENYGHDGIIDRNGMGIGEFTIYDWGNGAAAENYQRLLDHHRIESEIAK